MVIGQKQATVSSKKQIAFPKEFREVFGDRLIVTKGIGNYLIIVSERSWKTLLEGTEHKPFTNSKARETQRYILGNAQFIEVDKRGRFIIPEFLRTHAGIEEEVIFLGVERFVEIWDKKTWEEHESGLQGKIESLTDSLEGEDTGR